MKHAPLAVIGLLVAVLVAMGIGLYLVAKVPAEDSLTDDEATTAATRERRRVTPPPPAPATPAVATATPEARRAERPPEPPPGNGLLQGTVVDAVTGEAVVRCHVEVLHPTGERIAEAHTDAGGRYGFEGLPDQVPLATRLSASGYLTGLCCDVQLVPARVERKDVRLLRAPQLQIRATRGRSGEPAADALVTVTEGDREIGRIKTDTQGRARLAVPGFGRYVLHVGGRLFAENPGEPLEFAPGRGDVERDVELVAGSTLDVTIVHPTARVSGAQVLLAAEGLEPRSALAGPQGLAQFRRLHPGLIYEIVASLEIEDGMHLSGRTRQFVPSRSIAEARVTLHSSRNYAGRLSTPRGEPVADALVTVRFGAHAVKASTRTDAAGRFVIGNLPDGPLDVTIEAKGHATRKFVAGARPPTALEMLEAPPLTLDWRADATVVGRVRDEQGRPLPGAVVRAAPSGVRAESDVDGGFRLPGLPPDEEQRIAARLKGFRMPPGRAPTVIASEAGVHRLDIVLERATVNDSGGRRSTRGADGVAAGTKSVEVRGRVIDARGRPVAAARVLAPRAEGFTDEEGVFRLPEVAPPQGPDAAPAFLEIRPPPGLLTVESVIVTPPADGYRIDVGTIVLRARPVAVLRLPDAEDGPDVPVVISLVAGQQDEFLQHIVTERVPQLCVSYDRAWLLLPRRNAWRDAGHGVLWAAVPTARGIATEEVAWRIEPDDVAVLTVDLADAFSDVEYEVPAAFAAGLLRFQLVRSRHALPTGEDPLEKAHGQRAFARRIDKRRGMLISVPRGRWEVVLEPPAGTNRDPLRSTLDTESAETARLRIK